MKNRDIIISGIIVFLIIFIITTYLFVYKNNSQVYKNIKIRDAIVKVEIADTKEKREKGLSKRKSLDENNGMFFIYYNKEVRTFWMKEMQFPIDIIWVDNDMIAGIEGNVSPNGESEKRTSTVKVNKVIELNSGFCNENNIEVGDKIEIIN